MPEQHTTPVYRIENPDIQAMPDGVTSHEELVGQWFSPNLDTALRYLRKSTQTFGKVIKPVDGAQLVVAYVPTERLSHLHVSQHPIGANMDVENDNYIVPRDGSVRTDIVPLDEVIGDLRGQLGNFNKKKEARQRIHSLLGELSVNNMPQSESDEKLEPAEIILKNKVLYHGSATSGIDLFKPADDDTVGQGIYFVDNSRQAAGYARLRSKRDKSPPVVYETEIAKARLVNLDNPEKLQKVMQDFATSLRQADLSGLPWYRQGAVVGALDAIAQGVSTGKVKKVTQPVGGYFAAFLKAQGYDGLKAREGGEGHEIGSHETYLIFDPDKVKIKAQRPVKHND